MADKKDAIVRFLGVFSLGLGAAQVLVPGRVSSLIGLKPTAGTSTLMRLLGLREITAGLGIFGSRKPIFWTWSRVMGDVMDLTLLGVALGSKDSDQGKVAAAIGSVVGVAALDLRSALKLSSSQGGAIQGAGEGNTMRVERVITVNRTPEEVYNFWHNFENLPRFMSHLESVQVSGDGRSHWKAKAPAGKTVEWDAEVTEDRPNELIAWRSLPGADVDNSGSVSFTEVTGGRGTQVQVKMEYEAPGGPLGAVVAKLFGEEPDRQVQEDLRHFKQVMETGEVVYSDSSYPGHVPGTGARPPESTAETQ